ncbi:MAG: 5'-nucleotidase C-terminal domain-containing protein [Cyclobacteriaceae bacterium]|nr:5'-nucleotidase C-terminal domain-containing protein [Cyclobacteriaceae bacterium]MCH8517281.1 5'-nucleotidase C-terminal domain-containing protein [Cyclobacteriaceae bacterium]
MQSNITKSIYAILLISLLSACSADTDSKGLQPGEQMQLSIMATTDLHGRILPYDYNQDTIDTRYGLAQGARIIDSVRKVNPHHLLLDAGDFIQGNSLAEYFAKEENHGKAHPLLQTMNFLQYDAIVLGNHEFNFGLDYLNQRIGEIDAPVMAANVLRDDDEQAPAYEDMIIKEVNGVKVAILGLTTPGSAVWDRNHVEGKLIFEDGLASAKKYIDRIREQADVAILLAHSGWESSNSYSRDENMPDENFVKAIADELEDFDLLIMGHTHREFSEIWDRSTGEKSGAMQAGRWGSHVAIANLTISKDDSGKISITDLSISNEKTQDRGTDGEIEAMVSTAHETVREYVNEELTTTYELWDAINSFFEENALTDLIHRVQLDHTGADISVSSVFSTRVRFEPGAVSRKNVVELYPFENLLYTVELSGSAIKDYLENAASYLKIDEGHPSLGGGPSYNYDQMDGISYRINLNKKVGNRIEDVKLRDGSNLNPEKTYTVAINSYRAEGGGGYDMLKKAEITYKSEVSVRQLIESYLQNQSTLNQTDILKKDWGIVF